MAWGVSGYIWGIWGLCQSIWEDGNGSRRCKKHWSRLVQWWDKVSDESLKPSGFNAGTTSATLAQHQTKWSSTKFSGLVLYVGIEAGVWSPWVNRQVRLHLIYCALPHTVLQLIFNAFRTLYPQTVWFIPQAPALEAIGIEWIGNPH